MSDYFEKDDYGYPWYDGWSNVEDVASEARRRTLAEGIQKAATKDLVAELSEREGVSSKTIEPEEEDGPCILLTIID